MTTQKTERERLAEAEKRLDERNEATKVWIQSETQARARCNDLETQVERLKEPLRLIAAPKRSDGTYNRCREACEQIAREALQEIGGEE